MPRYLTAAWLAFIVLVASIGTFGQVQEAGIAPNAPPDEQLAEVGQETTERACGECHPVDEVTVTRRTSRDWSNMVDAMAARGATATDRELATIKRYLTRYFGLVPVNTASVEELSAVLGVSPQDAKRIVDYRKRNGDFTDMAALLKVPDADRKKIEAQPEALRFK